MKVYHAVIIYLWCYLQFYDCTCSLALPKIKANQYGGTLSTLHRQVALPKNSYNNFIHNDKMMLMQNDGKKSYPSGNSMRNEFYHFDLPPEGLNNVGPDISRSFRREVVDKNDVKREDKNLKLVKILSASGFFNNTSAPTTSSTTILSQLESQISLNLTQQYCSKDKQQKCKGIDLSYLLPIPGDVTTTTASSTTKKLVKNQAVDKTMTHLSTNIEIANPSVKFGPYNTVRSGRGCRKVADSTLDALKKFQLTHGIFAPNEEEVEKAVEKARINISRGRNKFPYFLKQFKPDSDEAMFTTLQDNLFKKANNKVSGRDLGDLYRLIPKFKIERLVEQNAAKPAPYQINSEVPFIYQNAATIKKQLETIRQYDVLLANIRAQAQLKLIELVEQESKHHIEKLLLNNEYEHGFEDLRNMEEVLRQEIKLAKNMPGASLIPSSPKILDNIDVKLINTSLDGDVLSDNNLVNDKNHKSEAIQEAVLRNNKLLEELDHLLHDSENVIPQLKDSYIKSKKDRNAEEKAFDKYSLLEKALGRSARNLIRNPKNPIVDKIKNKYVHNKRNTRDKRTVRNHQSITNNYEQVFQNLQSNLMKLKDQFLTHNKSAFDPKDNNVLVQIKVSVDVANTTDDNHQFKREVTPAVNSNKQEKYKSLKKNGKLKQ